MAERPLIMLHGWNDTGDALDNLALHLKKKLADTRIYRVAIGDYLSKDDALRFDDLQAALDEAWTEHGLPRDPFSVDVIVHSTGGLVIRDWLWRHFTPDASPVKHLVMLAPANFGSPLAHLGRSMLGRVANGFFSRQEGQAVFETGARILKGLELASPFTWELALRDRFGDDGIGMYAPGRTLCTVLVGNTGYGGIRSVANEEGGDGTVRISTANMNCAMGKIAFTEQERDGWRVTVPRIAGWRLSGGRTAFRILDGIDHSSIKLDTSASRLGKAQQATLSLIARALTMEDTNFEAFCDECEGANSDLTRTPGKRSGKAGYQNTVTVVADQFGEPVGDYMIEFYDPRADRRDGGALARDIHGKAIQKVHPYSDNSAYRSFYFDTARLHETVSRSGIDLGVSITAEPMLDEREEAPTLVGFRTFADEDIDDLRLDASLLADFFQPHRTLLLDILLHRSQAASVFRLRDPR